MALFPLKKETIFTSCGMMWMFSVCISLNAIQIHVNQIFSLIKIVNGVKQFKSSNPCQNLSVGDFELSHFWCSHLCMVTKTINSGIQIQMQLQPKQTNQFWTLLNCSVNAHC